MLSVVLTRPFSIGLNLFPHIGLGDSVRVRAAMNRCFSIRHGRYRCSAVPGYGFSQSCWRGRFARFYHESQMIVLFSVLAFSCVIAVFASTSLLNLARHLGVGNTSMLQLVGQVVYFVPGCKMHG